MGISKSHARGLTSGLVLLALLAGTLPVAASAWSRFNTDDRLCARQDALGSRLSSSLIDSEICHPTPAPTVSLSADPLTIDEGDSATLTWNSTNATSCTASGGWTGDVDTSGSEAVSPVVTTSYTLHCDGINGSDEASVTVTVIPAPEAPTLSLSVNPTSITEGESAQITWDSEFADTCTAANGWSGAKSVDGTESVSPTQTTTYELMCEGAGGNVTQSVTLTVIPAPEPTLSFAGDPLTIEEGQSSTLVWDSEHADTCTASNGWTGPQAVDGSLVVSPTVTTTYSLECTGIGGSVSGNVTVTVTAAPESPTLSLSADPMTITEGESSTLLWDSTNADSCSAADAWSGAKLADGSEVVSPLVTSTYVLDCTGAGGTVQKSVTITVNPVVSEGSLLITEVLYDLGEGQGDEPGNEWIEIYNGTNSDIDLGGYSIHDAAGSDVIPEGTILLSGNYLVVTATTTTGDLWSFPDGTHILVLGSSIGSNGLGNDGDMVELRNTSDESVDAVSWGTNVTAFNPSVTDVVAGHSIERADQGVDTDTAADWMDQVAPSPGA